MDIKLLRELWATGLKTKPKHLLPGDWILEHSQSRSPQVIDDVERVAGGWKLSGPTAPLIMVRTRGTVRRVSRRKAVAYLRAEHSRFTAGD